MPGLGRIHVEDTRDLQYLMRAAKPGVIATPLSDLPPVKLYRRGKILDQGETSCCVEFSLEAKLRAVPITVPEKRLLPRYTVYDEAIQIDEFPDNDGDTRREMGTSVRAGCKVLQRHGYIEGYVWAYSVDDILKWMLGGQGGINLGIDWYQDMFTPSDEGIIRATGPVVGGHAIYGYGIDRTAGMLYLQQSWGLAFGGWKDPRTGKRGSAGCIKLPFDELATLLKGNGEAVSITEAPYRRGALV